MTEIELIDLGFKRNEVSQEESGTEKGFYYYTLDLNDVDDDFCLISNEDDNTINGKWWVEFFNVEGGKQYFDKDTVKGIIDLIRNGK